jgi:uncharacterized protein involved in exopolysaccharide biosynthesis
MTNGNGTRIGVVQSDDVEMGLSDAMGVLVARKWTILTIAVIVAAASVFSATRQPTMYSSRASVLVTSAANSTATAQQLLSTEKQLARSLPVAQIVARDLRLTESPEELRKNLSVSIPLETQLLEFHYSAATPEAATRINQGFVDAYLKYQAQLLAGLIASTRSIDVQLAGLQTQLVNAQARLSGARTPAQVSAATDDLNSLTAEISAIEQKRTTLLGAAPIASTISERAGPATQQKPPYKRAGILGFAAGLVLGSFVAYALELRARRRARRRRPPQAMESEPDVPPVVSAEFGNAAASSGWNAGHRPSGWGQP